MFAIDWMCSNRQRCTFPSHFLNAINTVVYLKLRGLKWRFDCMATAEIHHHKMKNLLFTNHTDQAPYGYYDAWSRDKFATCRVAQISNNDKNRNCCQYAEVLQSWTDGLQQTVTAYIYVFTTLLNFLALQLLVLVVCKRLFLCNYPWIPWLLNTYFLRTVCDESFV